MRRELQRGNRCLAASDEDCLLRKTKWRPTSRVISRARWRVRGGVGACTRSLKSGMEAEVEGESGQDGRGSIRRALRVSAGIRR